VEHGKAPIPSVAALLQSLDDDPRFSIFPIDRAVIQRSTTLATVGEMRDRLIVATALTLAVPGEEVRLLTRDENITASKVVAVVW
jgi:PIN domain nuclease of toxin-antitoxin system